MLNSLIVSQPFVISFSNNEMPRSSKKLQFFLGNQVRMKCNRSKWNIKKHFFTCFKMFQNFQMFQNVSIVDGRNKSFIYHNFYVFGHSRFFLTVDWSNYREKGELIWIKAKFFIEWKLIEMKWLKTHLYYFAISQIFT